MYKIIGYEQPDSHNTPFDIYNISNHVYASKAELNLVMNGIDNMTITVNQRNSLYTKFKAFNTYIEVFQNETLIFRGRGISQSNRMESGGMFYREYTFEGIGAYLLDTGQGYYKNVNTTAGALFKHIIDHHNQVIKKNPYKQFVIGKNNFNGKKEKSFSVEIDYKTTKESILDILLKSAPGYITFEYSYSKTKKKWENVINYLKTPGMVHKSASPITIGSNIKSVSRAFNVQDVATRIIPLGEEIKPKKVAYGDDTTTEEIDGKVYVSGATHKVHGSWASAVRHAAGLLGIKLTSLEMKQMLHLIAGESSGNENSTNTWDGNAQKGDPSVGLTQYTESNFKAYAIKGFTNQRKGFDCLLAFFNTSGWRQMLAYRWTHSNYYVIGKKTYTTLPKKYINKKHLKSLNKWGYPFKGGYKGYDEGGQFGYTSFDRDGNGHHFHDGFDFGSAKYPESEIHAIHGGKVHLMGYRADGAKYYLVIRSRDGYDVVYQEAFSSMADIHVKKGQTVKTGEVIGVRTTNHLHIGVVKKPYSWYKGYMNGHSFEPWHWKNPIKLIEHGGEKGDKATNAKYFTEEKTKRRYDIKSVNKNKNYIDIPELQKLFGVRYKYLTYDNVKSPQKLLKLAKSWIKKQAKDLTDINYEIDLIELPKHQPYKVGDSYYFTDLTGNIEPKPISLMITSKTIDIVSNPYNIKVGIGKKPISLAYYELTTRKQLNSRINELNQMILNQGVTMNSIQSDAYDLENTVERNKNLAKSQTEQAKFNTKLLRRSVREHRKKTNKKLEKIDKFNKEELPKNYVSIKDFNALKDELEALKTNKADNKEKK